jgi:peptide deformylase
MAVRPVLKMGEPLLRQVAAPVQRVDAELAALVADMNDTMRSLNGAGLAAPQIGVSLRVVIFEVTVNPRYPEAPAIPYTVLINPELTPLGEEQEEGWEGCLSVPGLRGASISGARPSTARWKDSTRGSCSTRSITSTASSIPSVCVTCGTSASRKRS